MTEEKDATPKPTGHDFVDPHNFEIDEQNKSWRTMQSISEQTLMHNTFGTQLLCKLSTCNLNQFALDFDGNLQRIKQSVLLAKKSGSRLRNGSELEITGYGCEDHFLEQDTYLHSWQSIYDIINNKITQDILCCFGMPVRHKSAVYNCFLWILNNKILLIRPKLFLANDGNYREMRYFTSWTKLYELEEYLLPPMIQKLTKQKYVAFGAGILELNDTRIATECCEEMFTPDSPHILYALNGVEIYCNGSGSHHNLRKLYKRVDLIRGASARCGGAYLYANQQGCDGNRLYYDGCAMIINNGLCLAQATQFSIHEVEVVSAVVDLSSIRAYRHIPSFGVQSDAAKKIPTISVNFWLSDKSNRLKPAQPIKIKYLSPQEEIALGPSYWLWDYLRRSGGSGYFLPLSGGADSAATATLVGIMCQNIVKAINDSGDLDVLYDIRKVLKLNENDKYIPKTAKELCSKILHTTYMGTTNSSKETRERALNLSLELGSYHLNCDIDILIDAMLKLFTLITNKTPKYQCNGGDWAQNLALQNIQARLRMVLSYFLAQLLPWIRGKKGFLLVLGSANVDEALRGYYTKYDCSAADINPIGGICKNDLKTFLLYAAQHYGYKSLIKIVEAPPTAELLPITQEYKQTDEDDMGMTYAELGTYGKLRNIERCGPVSMYQKLEQEWGPRTTVNLSPTEIGKKVKYFFKMYGINRHKQTILTPSYHAENYSPDDNRYDHRQFLYPNWKRQFNTIDALINEDEKTRKDIDLKIGGLKRQSSHIMTNINNNYNNNNNSNN
eukprot:37605_1